MTIEGARQLIRMNLVGSTKDEKDDHIFACHDALGWLAQRLEEEIKWGHRECTHDDCKSSGTDCPANAEVSGGRSTSAGLTCSACHRCGSPLEGGVCVDETCPFSDHVQACGRGWVGHPEHNADEDTPCTCKPNSVICLKTDSDTKRLTGGKR